MADHNRTAESSIEAVRREREEAAAREPELERARHTLRFVKASNDSTLVHALCGCGLWQLENLDLEAEGVREDLEALHRQHVERRADVKVEIGGGAGCLPIRITDKEGAVTTGIICTGRRSRTRCSFCSNYSVAQCDYPLEGKCKKCKGTGVKNGFNCHPCAGTGRLMCNKQLCKTCRAHKEPDEDYCPGHRAAAGFPPAIRKEPCDWMVRPKIVNRKCLRESCATIITAEDHALFFPHRSRAMCEACGEKYLEVAV
jgi:hypothetical protein